MIGCLTVEASPRVSILHTHSISIGVELLEGDKQPPVVDQVGVCCRGVDVDIID